MCACALGVSARLRVCAYTLLSVLMRVCASPSVVSVSMCSALNEAFTKG